MNLNYVKHFLTVVSVLEDLSEKNTHMIVKIEKKNTKVF